MQNKYRYHVGKPSIGQAEIRAVTQSLKKCQLTMGSNVRNFESLLATYLGTRNVVVCSSGTAALHLALIAARIGPGDEVLVPDLTYISTANAVKYVGGRVVLVDIDKDTWNINLDDAAKKINNHTKAIIPVHLYGTPCDMDAVERFASKFDLILIEDAAEAIGGNWEGKPLGTWGDMGMFSFYGNKVITTGEGGAVVTDNDDLANTVRYFRGQAQGTQRFYHDAVGYNYRMTDIQAAIGIAQLDQIETFLERRHAIVNKYRYLLGDVLQFPRTQGSAPWLFTGVGQTHYSIMERELALRGVEVRPMFVPMHRLPMYQQKDEKFPVTTSLWEYGISLPTYPELMELEVSDIARQVREVIYAERSRRGPNGRSSKLLSSAR